MSNIVIVPDEVKGATLGDSDRYIMMFTCEVCNHKMTKTFTKKSYHTGVVIIVCDNCDSKHLIADNLGWFRDKPVNVEDLAKEKGGQAVRVQNNLKLQQLLQQMKYVGYKDTINSETSEKHQHETVDQQEPMRIGEKGDNNKN